MLDPRNNVTLVVNINSVKSRFTRLTRSVNVHAFNIHHRISIPTGNVRGVCNFRQLRALLPLTSIITVTIPHSPRARRLLGTSHLNHLGSATVVVGTKHNSTVSPRTLTSTLRGKQLRNTKLSIARPRPLPTRDPL